MRYTERIKTYLTARPNKVVHIRELQHVIPGGRLHEKQVQNAMSRIRSEDNVRFQTVQRGNSWRYVPSAKPEEVPGKVTVRLKEEKPAAHRVREMREKHRMPNTVQGIEVPVNTPVEANPFGPETVRDKALAEVNERTTFRYMGFSDVNGALLLKASNGKAYVAREL